MLIFCMTINISDLNCQLNTVSSHVVVLRKRHYCENISNIILNVLVIEMRKQAVKRSVAYKISVSPVVLVGYF
jgi:hypothetical protein